MSDPNTMTNRNEVEGVPPAGKDGVTGTLYEIAVLPNTVEELVLAIYDQKGKDKVSRADALDMAGYLERTIINGTYGGNVPVRSTPTKPLNK